MYFGLFAHLSLSWRQAGINSHFEKTVTGRDVHLHKLKQLIKASQRKTAAVRPVGSDPPIFCLRVGNIYLPIYFPLTESINTGWEIVPIDGIHMRFSLILRVAFELCLSYGKDVNFGIHHQLCIF